jgi:hypothetical protein
MVFLSVNSEGRIIFGSVTDGGYPETVFVPV